MRLRMREGFPFVYAPLRCTPLSKISIFQVGGEKGEQKQGGGGQIAAIRCISPKFYAIRSYNHQKAERLAQNIQSELLSFGEIPQRITAELMNAV